MSATLQVARLALPMQIYFPFETKLKREARSHQETKSPQNIGFLALTFKSHPEEKEDSREIQVIVDNKWQLRAAANFPLTPDLDG